MDTQIALHYIYIYIKNYTDIAKNVQTRFDTSKDNLKRPLPRGKYKTVN